MEMEKRNRYIIIAVVSLLLFFVIIFVVFAIINSKGDKKNLDVTIKQLYSSDYLLKTFDNSFFIGSYEENAISVIIDNEGKEVFKDLENIIYDDIYKMKDGRYLIYVNRDNKFVAYIYDGTSIKKFYEMEDVGYVKPIVFQGIDTSYIVAFASIVEDDLYLYSLNSSGILVVDNVSLLGDYVDNGVYYTYNEEFLIVKNSDNLMGVIDINGEVIIDCKYMNIINTYDQSFVVQNSKGKYGVIDESEKELIQIKYKVIDYYRDYYLLVNNENKMALYDKDYKKIIGFKMLYDPLIEYNLRCNYNSINLYKVDGKVVVVNNYLESKQGIEYDKHNLYIIGDNKIIDTISQVGFGADDVIYTYNDDYVISIYDNSFGFLFDYELKDAKKIEDIQYVNNDIMKVSFVNNNDKNKTIYLDSKGKKVEFDLGDPVIKTVDYYGYLKDEKHGQVLTLYDVNGNFLDKITGSKIDIYNDYLIIDNAIYKITLSK